MSYDCEHYYVTFGGTLVQGEIWQCGLKFAPSSGEDIFEGAFDQIDVGDVYEAIRTWFISGDPSSTPAAAIGKPARLGWAKVAVIDRQGEYKYDAHTHVPAVAAEPTFTTTQAPQMCLVVTLWSGQNTQRANYGRFYQPSPLLGVSAYQDGRLSAGFCANVRTAARTMINNVNGEISTVGVATYPAIMSRVGVGQHRQVTQIGVGRVLDTQRRRRSNLDEDIVYAAM